MGVFKQVERLQSVIPHFKYSEEAESVVSSFFGNDIMFGNVFNKDSKGFSEVTPFSCAGVAAGRGSTFVSCGTSFFSFSS